MRRVLLVSACGLCFCAAGLALSRAAESDIRIAALLPLTGGSAEVGLQEQQGVEYAVGEINAGGGIDGHRLVVSYDDTQGQPDQAVLAFNREVDLHDIPALITAFSAPSLAIAPLATRKKVLVINPAAQDDKLGTASPYMFNTMPLVRDEAEVLTGYLTKTLGKKTAAIIYENSAAGISGRDDFAASFKRDGGTILSEDPVQPGDTNFRPVLLKAASEKPDVVFVNIVVGGSLPQLVQQVQQQGKFPTIVGTTFLTPAMGLPGSDGWYYTAIRGTLPENVASGMKKRFGIKSISVYAREYYNDTMILAQIAKGVLDQKKHLTGPNMRDELLRIGTFNGVAKVTFVKNTAVRNIDILQVQHGVGTRVSQGTAGQQ